MQVENMLVPTDLPEHAENLYAEAICPVLSIVVRTIESSRDAE